MKSNNRKSGDRLKRFLMMAFVCGLMAPLPMSAQKINFSVRNVTVQEAVSALNQSENYSVILNADDLDLDRKVSVSVRNATVEEVLDSIFSGQNVTYVIDGRRISVTAGKAPDGKEEDSVRARETKISGKITDSAGEPLVGASLVIAGTTQGFLTDIDGNFEISGVRFPAKVIVSYIGYSDIELDLTGNEPSPYNIVLDDTQNILDDVIVIGYGTQKRSNLSGAVGIVSGKELNARPVVSAANALQGADPSVNITFGTGSPEASYNINIRGALSLNSGSPLILADGVEVSLSQINPNDIESVTVLKDASTCAIYGAKASAGVVLITTKAGKRGDNARVSYNGRFGWQTNTTSTDFISNGYKHVTIVNEFMNNSSDATKNIFQYTEENGGLQKLWERRNDVTENPERPWVEVGDDGKYYYYGNFDWYGYFYNRVRPQQEHNISVSGGSEKISYYASGRYLSQDGMFKVQQDNYKDYAFRAKFSAQMFKWLKYSTNISYDNSIYTYGGHSNYEGTIKALQSNICAAFVPYNPDGTIVQYVNQLAKNSPIGAGRGGHMTAGTGHNSKSKKYITISNQLDIPPVRDLTFTVAYDYRYRDILNKYRNNTFEYSRAEGVIETFISGSVANTYQEVHGNYAGHNLNIYGTYNHSWNDHNFKFTGGGQYETYRSVSLDVSNTNLTNDELSSFVVATGIPVVEQDITAYKTVGFFARANYDWKGRYIVEVSARADGSSRFSPGSRWAFFPSASAAWTISEENFFAPARTVVDNMKLRFSAGSLGNQQVSNYAWIETITPNREMNDYTFDYIETGKYSSISDPISSGLTWETVTTYDVGLDMSFFSSRLNFTVDGYIRDTKNMLTTSLTLPDVYGANTPKANCADLRSKGWELTISWADTFGLLGHPFSYNVSATLGDYVTHITRYHNPDGLISDHYVGEKLGDIWGYHVDGLFKTDREAAEYQATIDDTAVNSPLYQCTGPAGNYLRAGDVRYADLDGNNVISEGSGTLDDHGDMIIIGNTNPRYNYSFRFGVNWLGIDISAFFQGVGRRDWYPVKGQASFDFWGPYAFPPTSFIHNDFYDNVWTETNRNAYFPRARGYNAYGSGSLATPNDRYIQNLAYLRLKNLTVGYTVPQKWTRKAKIEQIRIYFSGENLCYWSPVKRYTKTMDPELAGSSGTDTKNSGVGYAYPRTFSIGLDIQF